jgi:hypothetical protein
MKEKDERWKAKALENSPCFPKEKPVVSELPFEDDTKVLPPVKAIRQEEHNKVIITTTKGGKVKKKEISSNSELENTEHHMKIVT